MADRTEHSARRCAAGLAAAALVAATAAGTPAAAAAASGPPESDAGGAGTPDAPVPAWQRVPASAVFAPGAPPGLAAALLPADAGGGERAGAVAGSTLSVQVTDDREMIAAGEEALYTLTLRNDSGEAQRAIVSQRVSPDARFVDVGGGGTATGGVAVWRVPIEPGAEVERTTRVRMGEPGEKLWRVATTVCAQTEAGAPPVACATDANRIASTAREKAEAEASTAVSAPRRVLTVASIVTATLLVLATAVAVFVVWNRIRLGLRTRRAGGDDAA